MNYSALIQNRKSVREYTAKLVDLPTLDKIKDYHNTAVHRLLPELKTELHLFGSNAREALEGAAGYHQFLIGAPQYLVLLSQPHPLAHINAGYIMEDLVLKLADWQLDSCWLTFTSSDEVKAALGIQSRLQVAAIIAYGYGVRTTKRLRLNIKSMSNVDIIAKRHYMEPKRRIPEMVFLNEWGNTYKLEEHIGFFDDVLWESFYAASLSPSYLNRQAYGFLLHGSDLSLVRRPDEYNTQIDGDLSIGIVLLHFTAVAENWMGKLNWNFGTVENAPQLPADHQLIATCRL